MKGILAYILLSASCLSANASQSMLNDTIKEASTKKASYPVVRPVVSDESINTHIKTMRFSEASTLLEKKITQAKRKKEAIDNLEFMKEACQKGELGLYGTDHVLIIDSVVVDKSSFLSAYPISKELGTLTLSSNKETVQYQAELNGMILTPKLIEKDGVKSIALIKAFVDEPDKGSVLEGLGVDGDLNYPYLLPDGQMFYFAARSSEGYGNYDLYATRYDSDSKRFYKAENMGYPYNSYANDYMLVIDEHSNLGWFASDRYQPQDKVCIYTFIPNASRQTIDYDAVSSSKIRLAASLSSVKSLIESYTPEEKVMLSSALQRRLALSNKTTSVANGDFYFVVNNAATYNSLDDFKSEAARSKCSDWLQKTKNYDTLKQQIKEMRENEPSQRTKILNLEARLLELKSEIDELAKETRKIELSK